MASQSTIDRIDDAITILGMQKDLLLRGNADRPDSCAIVALGSRVRVVAYALDEISAEYGLSTGFIEEAGDTDFYLAGDLADDELGEKRGLRILVDEDYDR